LRLLSFTRQIYRLDDPLETYEIYALIDFNSLIHLQKNDFISSLRISIVAAVILSFMFTSAQQPVGILQQQAQEAIAQQQPEQETSQKIPLGTASGSNFTNYTNPQYGFSLLYPSSWINEEVAPGDNLTFLISFSPPPQEFGESIFVYMAVKNLTGNYTSLKQFAEQEISFLERPTPATSITEGTSVRTILESEPTTIVGNTPAYKVVYSERVSGTLSKIMEVYAVNKDKGYIMSYFTDTAIYNKYLPIVQKMIDSLNVTASSIQ
jgi:PsbP-like protein